jgi:hypothetical protein
MLGLIGTEPSTRSYSPGDSNGFGRFQSSRIDQKVKTAMPIPAFDSILNVLPPHVSAAGELQHLSPYFCTVAELCTRFATSAERKQILSGLLNLRAELFGLGIQGFQWLAGSFVEDIETQEGRPPNDIDVVTFVSQPADPALLFSKLGTNSILLNRTHVKGTFHVDHFWLPLGSIPTVLVYASRYWYGLFSHRRDRLWKGLLTVDLLNQADDNAASLVLGNKP